jgi:hypothetical protein
LLVGPKFDGRPAQAKAGVSGMNELLDRVIDAHGGLARWRGERSIDVLFNYSSALPDLKGFPGHHRPVMSVDASEPRTVIQRRGGDPDDR